MKILSAHQIREADKATIQNEPISSIDLLERAANSIAEAVLNHFPEQVKLGILCGKGNNGGDGLALARIMSKKGWEAEVYILEHQTDFSEDAKINFDRLPKSVPVHIVKDKIDLPRFQLDWVWVDAVLGSGISRPLEGLILDLVLALNKTEVYKIAIDIPTGMFADDNRGNIEDGILEVDLCLSLQFPKRAFFIPSSGKKIHHFKVLDIGLDRNFIAGVKSDSFFTEHDYRSNQSPRSRYAHKGDFGHGYVLGGFSGMAGAGHLSAKAALRSGIGKLTLLADSETQAVFQTNLPEAMVDASWENGMAKLQDALKQADALALGPGLGKSKKAEKAMKQAIQLASCPLVIDADGINLLAENKTWLEFLPPNTILTPHWGEFQRLVGVFDTDEAAYDGMRDFAKRYGLVLVVKGPNTCITAPDGIQYFNSSGHPCLASPGSGDVLTGMVLANLAKGFSPVKAASMGVYVHGKLGEDLMEDGQSESSVLASDLIEALKNWA